MRSFERAVALAGIAAGVLFLASGCAGTSLLAWKKAADIPTADEKHPVMQIVCVWEPSEGHGVDGLPTRGFAGQIMFFTRHNPTPVMVNGDVRIYEYDDQGTLDEQGKPLHQFDFLGESWTAHFRHSPLGPSYQVFIPYMRKSPWLTHCALRVRLTPPGGRPLFSDLVHVTLPGPLRKPSEIDSEHPLAAFRKSANLADFKLGATLEQRRYSAADGLPPEVAAGADHREHAVQVTEIDLTGRRAAAAGRGPAIGDAEIDRLLREYHQSQARPAPQAAPQMLPADVADEATPSQPARRHRLAPAAAAASSDGGLDAGGDDFDALFSGRQTRGAHPLADVAFDDHPLAGH
ncbi:MAG: hypothetical protein WED34_04560 [Planctomycetales bacterium]